MIINITLLLQKIFFVIYGFNNTIVDEDDDDDDNVDGDNNNHSHNDNRIPSCQKRRRQ